MQEMTIDEMIECLEKLYDDLKEKGYLYHSMSKVRLCIERLNKLKWKLITDAQRSSTVDGDLLLGNGQCQRVGVGNNHGGDWEIPFTASDFELTHGWTPTHYMPLNALPPVPKE